MGGGLETVSGSKGLGPVSRWMVLSERNRGDRGSFIREPSERERRRPDRESRHDYTVFSLLALTALAVFQIPSFLVHFHAEHWLCGALISTGEHCPNSKTAVLHLWELTLTLASTQAQSCYFRPSFRF